MGSAKSETFLPPAGVLVPRLHPWEENGWNSYQRRAIFRSWGQHFAQTGKNSMAMKYFNKCIDEYAADDFPALCMRSKFNRVIARAEDALDDSTRAADLVGPWHAPVNIQIADSLYDLNEFEANKMHLLSNMRVQVGSSKAPFERRLQIVNENFADNVGYCMRPFFLKNSKKICEIHERLKRKDEPVETEVNWKQLRDRNECDIQSTTEKEETLVSTLMRSAMERKRKNYFQTYLNRTWMDVVFLQRMRSNPITLLAKYLRSSAEREQFISSSYDTVKTFTRMLHARSPLYNEYCHRNTELNQRLQQHSMFRIQYQTRRNMLSILRTIQSLRQQKDVKRLRDFVRKAMGEYNVLKTTRVMPWKVEFMNEVYNHLALTLCETYLLPKQKVSPYDNESMCHLLGVSPMKPSKQREIVFGDRSTYTYENTGQAFEQAKAFKWAYLEKRLHFATMPIERSYLFYELADAYLSQNQQVVCLMYANKAIAEARQCSSKIWEFLATMLMAKSHAILFKFERQAEVLNGAYALARQLKSPRLCTFIELCRMLNRDYMTLRKMTQLMSTKRMRYKLSNRSSYSYPTQHTPDSDPETS
ncbi:hypothetical protein KR222_003992 [Zaprionus bogoriensis]|nr:hypothetical protein KR222_003992 [Zaprionus bogoriensis]